MRARESRPDGLEKIYVRVDIGIRERSEFFSDERKVFVNNFPSGAGKSFRNDFPPFGSEKNPLLFPLFGQINESSLAHPRWHLI